MILSSATEALLKKWAPDIKAGKFEDLIYKGFQFSDHDVREAILALREAGISPFNCRMPEEDFCSWVAKIVAVRRGEDLGQAFRIPHTAIETEELHIAKALGISCWEVKDPNHPHNGDLIFCNRYSNIAALIQTNYAHIHLKYRQLTQLF